MKLSIFSRDIISRNFFDNTCRLANILINENSQQKKKS